MTKRKNINELRSIKKQEILKKIKLNDEELKNNLDEKIKN